MKGREVDCESLCLGEGVASTSRPLGDPYVFGEIVCAIHAISEPAPLARGRVRGQTDRMGGAVACERGGVDARSGRVACAAAGDR